MSRESGECGMSFLVMLLFTNMKEKKKKKDFSHYSDICNKYIVIKRQDYGCTTIGKIMITDFT